MASYNDMARTVLDYYTNPEQLVQYGGWEKVFDPNNTYSIEQAYEAIRNNPNIQIIERTDGTIVGWWNKSTGSGSLVNDVGSLPNSNTAGGSVTSSALVNINTSPVVTQAPGSTTWHIANAPAVGEKWATNGGVCGALMVVASGIKLGLTIDKLLYEHHPDIFTDEQLESLNPDNWKHIGSFVNEQWTEMGYPTIGKIGQVVFDTLTYVGQDNSSQMYIDEDAFSYAAWYLQNIGAFSSGDYEWPKYTDGDSVSFSGSLTYQDMNSMFPGEASAAFNLIKSKYDLSFSDTDLIELNYTRVEYNDGTYDVDAEIVVTANAPSLSPAVAKLLSKEYQFSGNYAVHPIRDSSNTTQYEYFRDTDGTISFDKTTPSASGLALLTYATDTETAIEEQISYLYTMSNWGTATKSSSIPGTGQQPGAIIPKLSTATDLESFKTLLKQQYPDIWTKSVTRQVPQPDGTLTTFTYVPVPTPNATGWMDTRPTGDGSQQSQKDTVVNPDMDTSIKDSISSSTSTGSTTPNPPDTGGGSSPTVVPPVGKASSLWSIYNPTLEQVNQFGSWLWSSNFVEQLKKLFNDPMQAIIGLHKVYSPVQTSGQGTIKCGYLDSGVPSKLVSEQYVTVECGSVDLQEYFGNVFDYPPYTDISIYLPFIGIRQLDPSDVMRSTISVKYHIDVLTGACLAEVNVQRDAVGGTLYTFSGDAAVRYPVSSGSYMGIVSGLIGVATSAVSGNLLPALSGVTRLHTNVDHSGSFTGNAGAMASKIPYLIISRPQTAMADKFETLSGYPSNTFTPLSACKGFTQVKYCHVETLNATDAEKQEIEQLLKEGVIL
jgi:hypothetical protein